MRVQLGTMSELGLAPQVAQRFVNAHWKRRTAIGHPLFYRWQFVEAPANHGQDTCWVAADLERGVLLGLLGSTRRPFVLQGSRLDGMEHTTLIASPDGSRLGVGARLLMGPQERHEVLTGMNLSHMGTTAFLRAGYRVLREIPRFLRVLNLEKIRSHAVLSAPAEKLVRRWRPRALPSDLHWGPPTPEGVSACQVWLEQQANAFVRDEPHLRWRYDRHPFFQYYRLELHSPSGIAQLAYRIQDLPDFRILHLMDCFGSATGDAVPLVDQLAAEHGADVVDFFCTHSGINRHFYAGGWFSICDDLCFRFPHLFNPIELRETLTHSLGFWSRDQMASLADTGRLYVTKQDMDADRPAGTLLDSPAQ